MPQLPSIAQEMARISETQGVSIKDLTRNAYSKQYNMSLRLKITEDNGEDFFDSGDMTWAGVPYASVVIMEAALVSLLAQWVEAGKAIATGAVPPPAA